MAGSKFRANSARDFTQKAQSCYVGYYNPGVASTASRRLVQLCSYESGMLTLATGVNEVAGGNKNTIFNSRNYAMISILSHRPFQIAFSSVLLLLVSLSSIAQPYQKHHLDPDFTPEYCLKVAARNIYLGEASEFVYEGFFSQHARRNHIREKTRIYNSREERWVAHILYDTAGFIILDTFRGRVKNTIPDSFYTGSTRYIYSIDKRIIEMVTITGEAMTMHRHFVFNNDHLIDTFIDYQPDGSINQMMWYVRDSVGNATSIFRKDKTGVKKLKSVRYKTDSITTGPPSYINAPYDPMNEKRKLPLPDNVNTYSYTRIEMKDSGSKEDEWQDKLAHNSIIYGSNVLYYECHAPGKRHYDERGFYRWDERGRLLTYYHYSTSYDDLMTWNGKDILERRRWGGWHSEWEHTGVRQTRDRHQRSRTRVKHYR